MTDDRKSESGSAEVAPRMAVLRRHLHDAVPLDQAATDAGISLRTARRWLARYRADPKAARSLISAGEAARDPTLDAAELAACTMIAGLILNLDEAITKP